MMIRLLIQRFYQPDVSGNEKDKKIIRKMEEIKRFKNYINGKWVHASSGETFQHRNPSNLLEVTGIFPLATKEDALDAIGSAQVAFAKWMELSPFKRAEYLKKALALMIARRKELARVITLENGKILSDSLIEIDAAIGEMEFQINQGLRLFGETIPVNRKGVFAYTIKEPLGVVGVISPWNFPFNVVVRKSTPALMAGNTLVFKPASLTPQTGVELTKLFDDAGIPEGVFNMIIGSGSNVGNVIVTDKRIKAISFTGSTEVGMRIHTEASINGTRTQLEMGGKNAAVILEDADTDLAISEIIRAGYACSGQWCTSTSRIIVVNKIIKEFTKKLVTAAQSIIVGDGFDPASQMGPVCGEDQVKTIMNYIQKGQNEGARLITGGKKIQEGKFRDGCFIEPTIFDSVRPDMEIAQEEIFGPVLTIIAVDSMDEAIGVANDIKFGLSSSVYTNNLKDALKFIGKTEAGLTHVNLLTSYKEPQLPFGGIKKSGVGMPEAGTTGVEFFIKHKSVYINFG
jgi:alpha-ketoglutaric semialdehyde dehydrogenase